ncbi:MAG: Na(+)-translocating NADH-quinone reductase subunit A [Chlamydiia bacterium]|nr:Na(+)-translocating NADH-quinone reductase subunit A [Chlamydiia bacterium]
MDLVISKGLDIPLAGAPTGSLQTLASPRELAFCFDPFEHLRFKLLVHVGDHVQIGQPIAESKKDAGLLLVSPAGGCIKEIRRGSKRSLLAVVITKDPEEATFSLAPLDHERITKEEILDRLMKGGGFPSIRMRPFCQMASPSKLPRNIFVKAIESAPFVPPSELQVSGHEQAFEVGLSILSKIAPVHLVHRRGSPCKAFTKAKGVHIHTAKGPHPIANSSVHIHHISPISHPDDFVWTLDVLGVLTVGKLFLKGVIHIDRVIGLGGGGFLEDRTGFFKGRAGFPLSELIADRIQNRLLCFISGDPLGGSCTEPINFLGFFHTTFSVIPVNTKRESFHFLRLGIEKYSATKTYLSGHLSPPKKGYAFTTNQHGEERPFIDGRVYEKVMPMRIPTMHLVKAALAEDFELAQTLGILEVDPEDFALPSFVCPSKIEMMDIIERALHLYAAEMGI